LPSAAEILAFTRVLNIIVVPADVAGTTALLGIDTGSPFVLLNPTTFPRAPAVGSVSSMSVDADTLQNVPVITSSISPTSPDPAVPLGGLLGCAFVCNSVVSFDYRAALFTIGNPVVPSGLSPETVVPFSFDGGGVVQSNGTAITEPRSRVVVSVDVEGTARTMVVDTGASDVIVTQAVFDALTSDGRPQLSGAKADTTLGVSSSSVTRAKTVAVGGAQAQGVLVAHDSSFDQNLAAISTDSGVTIDGSLGGSFLQSFYVTIDYPNRTLHLAPYADTSFISDGAEVVGVSLGPATGGAYPVAQVLPGTDAAAKGVTVGDTIVAVDGQSLASLTISEVLVLLGGKVGSTKAVQFGAAATLAHQTVPIKVDELLPP
jgi:S1-C subfamily serine protease